jgi:enoyl-[acyl-carrier-protein] reductase (NADH)
MANTDSRPIQETMEALANKMNVPKQQMIAQLDSLSFLKHSASTSDRANAAVLLASDRARMITGTVFNATAGAALD